MTIPTSHAPESDRLLRVDEAAEFLAISPRTLWTLTNSGRIKCVHVGKNVRYSRADLLAFAAKGGAR